MDFGFLVGQTILDLPPPFADKLLGNICDYLTARALDIYMNIVDLSDPYKLG